LGDGGSTGTGATSSGGSAGTGSGGDGGSAGTGGVVSGGGSSGSGASGGSGGDGGPGTLTYNANLAECIALDAPDPTECEATAGAGLMTIDLSTAIVGGPAGNHETAGFLRFDMDSALTDKIVESVTLRMTVGNQTNSGSTMSGEINLVACFTLSDLSNEVPMTLGGGVVSPDQGTVTMNQVVDFPLPLTLVNANQPTCLAIYTNTMEGVDYFNNKGASPPQLIIEVQ
jgi:hypothetical protein